MRITPQQVSERLVPAEFITQMTQRLNEMEQDILSRTTLEGIITTRRSISTSATASQRPMEDIVSDMRTHDIDIQPIQVRVAPAAPTIAMMATAFSISFTYPDRYKAQAVVRELVTNLPSRISRCSADKRT